MIRNTDTRNMIVSCCVIISVSVTSTHRMLKINKTTDTHTARKKHLRRLMPWSQLWTRCFAQKTKCLDILKLIGIKRNANKDLNVYGISSPRFESIGFETPHIAQVTKKNSQLHKLQGFVKNLNTIKIHCERLCVNVDFLLLRFECYFFFLCLIDIHLLQVQKK